MLKIEPITDKTLLNKLSLDIFDKEFGADVGFVLFSGNEAAGLAKIKVSPFVSHIIEVGIIKEDRGKGFGDFLTRSLLNALTFVSEKIAVSYISPYFDKFGFEQNGEEMVVEAENLVFPRKCGG